MTTAQLQVAVEPLQYKCETNTDQDNPYAPGTAAIWREDLPTPQVANLISCSLQTVRFGQRYFYNVYAPSGSENRRDRAQLFTRDIFPLLLQHMEQLPVLAGDWNCLVAAKDTTANFQEKYSKDLDNLLKAFKYSDAYRILHPNTSEFTFHRASCAPSRLDRVYLPPNLVPCLRSVEHQPGLADHWGVHVKLEIEMARAEQLPRPRKTHWKLNTNILKHESFLPQLTRVFQGLKEEVEEFEDEADWWDMYAKPAITSFCKTFSASLAKQRRTFKAFLLALLRVAVRKNDWKLMSQTKEKLQNLIANEAFGLVIRSRTKQNAEEEAASLYHLGKAQKTGLNKLKVSDNGIVGYKHNMNMVVTEDKKRIEEETVNFMEALLNGRQDQNLEDTGSAFEPDYTYLEDFLSNLSQLSAVSQDSLVEELSCEEVEVVVKSCKTGKSPGLDGLPYEFYLECHWNNFYQST